VAEEGEGEGQGGGWGKLLSELHSTGKIRHCCSAGGTKRF
jgi:hypothetical protein